MEFRHQPKSHLNLVLFSPRDFSFVDLLPLVSSGCKIYLEKDGMQDAVLMSLSDRFHSLPKLRSLPSPLLVITQYCAITEYLV